VGESPREAAAPISCFTEPGAKSWFTIGGKPRQPNRDAKRDLSKVSCRCGVQVSGPKTNDKTAFGLTVAGEFDLKHGGPFRLGRITHGHQPAQFFPGNATGKRMHRVWRENEKRRPKCWVRVLLLTKGAFISNEARP